MPSISGITPLRYPEIREGISTRIFEDFGGVVDLSVDALMGVYTDIVAITEADIWELSQAVYDSTNLMSAEGYLLDNLALLVGVVRLSPTYTKGILWISGQDGVAVPEGARFQSVSGDYFQSTHFVNISSTDCIQTEIHVTDVVQDEDYIIVVDGNIYRREATPNQTREEILQYFYEVFQADEDLIVVAHYKPEAIEELSHIHIATKTPTVTMVLSATSYFTFRNVTTPVEVQAEQAGDVSAKAGTINRYVASVAANIPIVDLTNPTSFEEGRARETDEELRDRIVNMYLTVAGGSADSIQEAVANVQGVSAVRVIENITDTATPDGMPPKSFKVIVHEGDELNIAKAIWSKKPAGVICYADRFSPLTSTVTFEDYNTQKHTIRFIRPTEKYIWIHGDYTLYSEEVFTASGETIMKEALATFGDSLNIGHDVIPDRFYPSVYKNVKGVEDLELYFAVTDDLNTSPVYPDDYSQAIIEINEEQVTNFSNLRVSVTKV